MLQNMFKKEIKHICFEMLLHKLDIISIRVKCTMTKTRRSIMKNRIIDYMLRNHILCDKYFFIKG